MGRARAFAGVVAACVSIAGCASSPCDTPRPIVLSDEPPQLMSADHAYVTDEWASGKGSDHLLVQTSDLQSHADLANVFATLGLAAQSGSSWSFTDAGNQQSTSNDYGRVFVIGTSIAGPFEAGYLTRSCSNGSWDERMLRFTERFMQLTPLGEALLKAGLLAHFQNGRPPQPWKGLGEPIVRVMDYPEDNKRMTNESLKVVRFEGDALDFPWANPSLSQTYQ